MPADVLVQGQDGSNPSLERAVAAAAAVVADQIRPQNCSTDRTPDLLCPGPQLVTQGFHIEASLVSSSFQEPFAITLFKLY